MRLLLSAFATAAMVGLGGIASASAAGPQGAMPRVLEAGSSAIIQVQDYGDAYGRGDDAELRQRRAIEGYFDEPIRPRVGPRERPQGPREFRNNHRNNWYGGRERGGYYYNNGPREPRYVQPRPVPPRYSYRLSPQHVDWCYARYRSYRAADNSYQPYGGPRRMCVSPYS